MTFSAIFFELKNYIEKEEEQDKILSIIAYIMELTEISPEKLTEIMKRISLSKGEGFCTKNIFSSDSLLLFQRRRVGDEDFLNLFTNNMQMEERIFSYIDNCY